VKLAPGLGAAGKDGQAATIKNTRWALVKNPADLMGACAAQSAQWAVH
jgi:hypothetical protein